MKPTQKRSAAGASAAERSIGERLRCDSAALSEALRVPLPEARREVQVLLSRALGWNLARLLAYPEAAPGFEATERYERMLARRLTQEPLAYILSEREFYSLTFEVSPAVLIPRPETELLVELALARVPTSVSCRILELGAGSGCIAVTVAKLRPHAQVVATDLSDAALEVLVRNAGRHGVTNLTARVGNWFDVVDGERFDLILSNPPYIAERDPHLSQGDLRFEPPIALQSGADGLDALREITAQAPRHLMPGGWLLVEHAQDQEVAVSGLMKGAGFTELFSRSDLAGIPRVAGGRLP